MRDCPAHDRMFTWPLSRRTQFNPWVRKIPWRRNGLPTPIFLGFPGGSDGKESACNMWDLSSTSGLGRSPRGGHGNPFQYSCLENPHEQRSLVGDSPWGHTEWDMTEWLSTLASVYQRQYGTSPVLTTKKISPILAKCPLERRISSSWEPLLCLRRRNTQQ